MIRAAVVVIVAVFVVNVIVVADVVPDEHRRGTQS